MKKNFCLITLVSLGLQAQVGINTNTPEATLDVRATNHLGAVTATDGVLVPRVNSLANNGSADGQLVFLIADENANRPKGYYYWDTAQAKWVRLSFVTGDNSDDAWIDDPANTMVKLATSSNGTTPRTNANNVIIKDDGRVGVGNVNPLVSLDLRTNPGNANPGEGAIGIGESTLTANAAGAGAIRYNATSKKMELSNKDQWMPLDKYDYQKVVVTARMTTGSNEAGKDYPNNATTVVTGWNVVSQTSSGNSTPYFDGATGSFTVPRAGHYNISFGFNFAAGRIANNSRIEAIIQSTQGTTTAVLKRSVVPFPAGTGTSSANTAEAGANVNFVLKLDEGAIVQPAIFHNLGYSKNFRVGPDPSPGSPPGPNTGFINFSVVEL